MLRKDMDQFVQAYLSREGGMKVNLTEAHIVVEAVMEAFRQSLALDGSLRVRNFGSFSVRTFAPRNMKDLAGKEITIPEHKQITFRAAEDMKNTINGRD